MSTPTARKDAIAAAEKVAKPNTAEPAALTLDPFSPPPSHLRLTDEPVDTVKAAVLTDQQIAELLVRELHPTASVTIRGEPYLLFTEKRQKIGDNVSVVMGQVEYNVELVSISPRSFRIRYKGHEAERNYK
jgi:hypothetical protein